MTQPLFPHPPVPVEPPAPDPFPVDALPAWLAEYVDALSGTMQVPAELPALMSLAVTSVATAGQVFVRAKDGWVEPCAVYTAVALPPGSLKSPTVDALRVPVDRFEDELKAAARPQLAERQMRREFRPQVTHFVRPAALQRGAAVIGRGLAVFRSLRRALANCRLSMIGSCCPK